MPIPLKIVQLEWRHEDLSVFETIETTVGLVDSHLRGDNEYDSLGADPVDRVKALLGKLDSVRRSKDRG